MGKVVLPDNLEKLAKIGYVSDVDLCRISPESCLASDVERFRPAAIQQRRYSDLNAGLRRFLFEVEADLPEEYRVGSGVVLHVESGIEVSYPPIQLGQASDSDILVFHYSDFKSFLLIVSNKRWKHLRASKGHDCANYGDGVYGTVKRHMSLGQRKP
eukprot:TRINITY_DN10541_c0_g1_i3.p1 TRINITY_DN10541_c0_g1~~TRINITY_DN10541_c0_g1_i3.p1  ORF type:complete len:170 (-),score=16.06 TRINITY_DN10541_c0_g1_i3:51-521(-)